MPGTQRTDMKFLSTRDLRNRPGGFRETVQREDVVLTANGKPFALAVGLSEDDFEETLDLVRRARAQRAISSLQRDSVARGTDRLSMEEIDAEIRAARAQRRTYG